jgi:thiamine-monophosphate kinase
VAADPGATLGSAGEEGLLRLIQPFLARAGEGRLSTGPGDDAAVWQPPARSQVVVTTDTLVEGVHFRPGDPAADLGWKLLAVSLSDLAAMGADPGPAFIAVSLPASWHVGQLLDLYEGLARCADSHGTVLAGGNFSMSPIAVLTSTCLGSVAGGRVLGRGGARPGWALALTGRVGGAAAALRRIGATHPPSDLVAAAWDERARRPEPRLGPGRTLLAAGIDVAIDVSDGVFLDAGRLLPGAAQRCGVLIDAARLPTVIGVRESWPASWLEVAGGGEDYELLFAGPVGRVETACRRLRKSGCEAAVIGRFDKGEGVRVTAGGEVQPAPATGHQHFA